MSADRWDLILKIATRLTVLICLISVTAVPVWVWALDPGRSLDGVGGFVAASAAPLGALIAALLGRKISKDRAPAQ